MKKLLTVFVALVIVAGGGLAAWRYREQMSAPPMRYNTVKVERGDIARIVTATGSLEPVNQVTVGAQVTGTVAKLHADYNSVVKKDQVIAEIDPAFLDAQLQETEAALVKARASARQSERERQRIEALAKSKIVSNQELEAARTSAEVAQASVLQAEAARDRAATNLRYATITSPIDGIVVSRAVEVGQTVAASLSAPELFVIAEDLSKMRVISYIDESDIGMIKSEQAVEFTVDAFPTDKFSGKVAEVRLASKVESNVVTYPVVINVSNPDGKLMPGMTANVSVAVAKQTGILRLPSAALRFQPAGWSASGSGGESSRGGNRAPGGSGGPRSSSGPGAAGGPGGSTSTGPPLDSEQSNTANSERHRPELPPGAQRGRVFILKDGALEMVPVVTGIDDGTWTELVRGPLDEGHEVVSGIMRATNNSKQQQDSSLLNRLMPRRPR